MVANMYKKILLSTLIAILATGCSTFGGAKPKAPNKKLPVKVVETIEPQKIYTPTPSENVESVTTIEDDKIKTKNYSSKTKTAKKSTPKLKPEPFSVESNQEDPELLGPQGNLKDRLHGSLEKPDSNSINS